MMNVSFDNVNELPLIVPYLFSLKKRRHDRVKTWTRHVDLFEKDFVFVPINKS